MSLWLAVGSAASILVSIAVSQILLALGLSVLLLSGLPLRWPKASAGLGLFLLWTLLSLAFSPDPGHGTAQIRKMFVFLILLVFYSSVRSLAEARWLVYAWAVLGTVTAGRGFYQYIRDITLAREANMDFYHYYISGRISGFMSHWMTFSGQQLFILLLVGAYLLFAPPRRERWWLWLPCGVVVGLALVLSDTRSVWLATLAGGFYLLWRWNVKAALAMPVLVAAGLLFAPAAVKQRAVSIVRPEKETDSNAHRVTAWRTGLQMIKAHPVFGVGPEEIAKPEVFDSYVPGDIQRPLPTGFYGHLHSIYIHYAAERGIPAALLLTGALLFAIWRFRSALLTLPAGRSYRRFLLEFAIAGVIGVMVSGVFELNLGDSEVLTMFLVVLCLGELSLNSSSPALDAKTGPDTYDIGAGFLVEQPAVLVPWNISVAECQQLFSGRPLRQVTDAYLVTSCVSMGGLPHELGFHFRGGSLVELEFFRRSHADLPTSYAGFQQALESQFGEPTASRSGSEGFPSHTWERNCGVEIVHFVEDRFGKEEHVRIRKL